MEEPWFLEDIDWEELEFNVLDIEAWMDLPRRYEPKEGGDQDGKN